MTYGSVSASCAATYRAISRAVVAAGDGALVHVLAAAGPALRNHPVAHRTHPPPEPVPRWRGHSPEPARRPSNAPVPVGNTPARQLLQPGQHAIMHGRRACHPPRRAGHAPERTPPSTLPGRAQPGFEPAGPVYSPERITPLLWRSDARPHVRSFSHTATPCRRPQQHARHRQADDPAADDDSRHLRTLSTKRPIADRKSTLSVRSVIRVATGERSEYE
jgi:hypothetical protein